MPELDPSVAAALNEPDDDDEGPPEDEEHDDEPETPQAAATEPAPPPRPAGRPKGSRNRKPSPGSGFAEPKAGPPTAIAGLPEPAPRGRPAGDRTMQQTWDDIVEDLALKGYQPADVTIAVRRFPVGPERSAHHDLNPIPGELVGGAGALTPGEELYEHVVRFYHIPLNAGPSRYRLWFCLRGTQRNYLGMVDLNLPPAVEMRRMIAMQDEARREHDRAKAMEGEPLPTRQTYGRAPQRQVGPHPDDPPFLGEPPPPMGGYVPPRYVGQPAMPQPQPMPPSPATAFADAIMNEWQTQAMEAIRRGMQPPPPPQAAAQPLTKADIAQTVVEVLQAMEAAKPKPVQSPPGGQEVTARVGDPLDGMERMFDFWARMDKMRDRMREQVLGDEPEATAAAPTTATVIAKPETPEEDEFELKPVGGPLAQQFMGAPVLFAPQKPEETTFQWMTRLASGNPAIAGKVLGKAAEMGMKIIDQAGLAKVVGAVVANAVPGGLPGGPGQVVESPQPQQNGAGAWKPNLS